MGHVSELRKLKLEMMAGRHRWELLQAKVKARRYLKQGVAVVRSAGRGSGNREERADGSTSYRT